MKKITFKNEKEIEKVLTAAQVPFVLKYDEYETPRFEIPAEALGETGYLAASPRQWMMKVGKNVAVINAIAPMPGKKFFIQYRDEIVVLDEGDEFVVLPATH